MTHEYAVQFVDRTGGVVATAQLTEAEGLFRGAIDLTAMPAPMRRVFEDFEETVNNQGFSLLDEIEEEVNRLGIRVRFGEPTEHAVEDLQIYPCAARVSLRPAHRVCDPTANDVASKKSALAERLG